MGDVLISSISRFSVIIKGLKQQIYEIEQIRRLMHSSLPTFLKALNDNVSKFESKHGEIKLPNNEDGFSPFGVNPPDENMPN